MRRLITPAAGAMIWLATRHEGFMAVMIFVSLLPTLPAQAEEDIEIAADVLQVALPATAYGTTFAFGDQEGRGQFCKSFLATMGITYGLKLAVDKERPDGGSGSFPSGHTAAAFSGASFIQRRYGWKYSVPAYLAASFVGWSRVETDDHYTEDVLAGAAIGVISTYCFTKPYNKNPRLVPVARLGLYGLAVESRW